MSGNDKNIRIKESAGIGVVEAGLEPVELVLGVVVITPVAEGVYVGRAACVKNARRAVALPLCREDFAPGIVGVGVLNLSRSVGYCHYVALEVLDEVILGRCDRRVRRTSRRGRNVHTDRRAGFVVIEPCIKALSGTPYEHRPVVEVFIRIIDGVVGNCVVGYRLLYQHSVGVVAVGRVVQSRIKASELPAVVPLEVAAEIFCRVAYCVVGVGRRSVGAVARGIVNHPRVGRQLILPKIVIVAVGVGPRRGFHLEYMILERNFHRVLDLGRDVAV